MPKKNNPINVGREEHKELRKKFGYDRKFYVSKGPYNRYEYLQKLSLKKEKDNEKEEMGKKT